LRVFFGDFSDCAGVGSGLLFFVISKSSPPLSARLAKVRPWRRMPTILWPLHSRELASVICQSGRLAPSRFDWHRSNDIPPPRDE
jgi:hypothetical protein